MTDQDQPSPESSPAERLDLGRLPRHVAIIMDGNGRWAQRRGWPRIAGHKAGVKALVRCVRACNNLGIAALTVYAFSTENWHRPKEEVSFLMKLLEDVFEREMRELHKNGVKVRIIGRQEGLAPSTLERITACESLTQDNPGLRLNIAFNYGGRAEIVDACRTLCELVVSGDLQPHEIDESTFSAHLSTAASPDPDLLIRTGGEQRISNFLLWQVAYCELYISDVYWPDFSEEHLLRALMEYQRRQRRFGKV